MIYKLVMQPAWFKTPKPKLKDRTEKLSFAPKEKHSLFFWQKPATGL